MKGKSKRGDEGGRDGEMEGWRGEGVEWSDSGKGSEGGRMRLVDSPYSLLPCFLLRAVIFVCRRSFLYVGVQFHSLAVILIWAWLFLFVGPRLHTCTVGSVHVQLFSNGHR